MQTRRLPLKLAPWTLFRALARKERAFFIDAGQPWGDEWVSSMGFRPRMQLRIGAGDARARAPFAALDSALAPLAVSARARALPRPVPFAGGALAALAYEAASPTAAIARRRAADSDEPHLVLAIYDSVVAYDHRRREYRVASWWLDDTALGRVAEEVLDAAAEAAPAFDSAPAAMAPSSADLVSVSSNFRPDEYAERVERVLRYLAAGDAYQVNLSMRLRAALPAPALDLYAALRAAQPVPFGGYHDLGNELLLCNSPELFLRRRGERVVTCPVKGTRRRGGTADADARLAGELRADPKECAEHVMIVDLERNDLGRVCRTGSVRVSRFAEVASFQTLHHLISTVEGALAPEVTAGELLAATFPGGSITGAPKIRAMEIIDELERGARGFYTGSLGWIDASGDLDLNVAIRTAVAADDVLTYHVGSGIVADSTAAREHAESLLKAQALLRALGLAAPSRAPRQSAYASP